MGTSGVSRRQQQLVIPPPPPVPSSGIACPHDLAGPKEYSLCGGYSVSPGRGITPLLPPQSTMAGLALGNPSRAFRMGLLLVACLSLPILALVSARAYYSRPSLALLSGNYGSATLQQPRTVQEGPELDFKSFTPHSFSRNLPPHGANIDAYGELIIHDTGEILSSQNSGDSSPWTSTTNSSDTKLPNSPVPANAKLHDSVSVASPPDSAGKINLSRSDAELQMAAAAGTPPAAAAGSSSEAAEALPSPGGDVRDKLLGSLLAASFDEESCLSRYQSASYRRRMSAYKPSPYLVESLRRYEALHERCGPYTDAYNRALLQLKPGRVGAGPPPCKYLLWAPENGLGNRMVSLASAFLYALLADRVLLIDRSKDLGRLFCEPFPGSTWLLPLEFPLKMFATFNQKHPQSYGNMLRTYGNKTTTLPPFVYAHLSHDYDGNDKRFFCEPDQHLLERAPWMLLRSDQYFVPALFLVPAFRQRLGRMFPEKEAAFHHLGRYLFHPSNAVWSMITDYYEGHLASASERLGIQIRLHFKKVPPFDLVVRQILNCTWTQKLLPDLLPRPIATAARIANGTLPLRKAVLLTSLHSGFRGRLEGLYAGRTAAGGAAVSFHQPSQEGRQQTGREEHDERALAEMYLLSMADELVTSAWSTFGYVAHGLGGLSPWILRGPVHTRVPEPACVRAVSMEPCFHYPPNYDCATGDYVETRKMLPFTSKCRDRKGGLKLVARKRRGN